MTPISKTLMFFFYFMNEKFNKNAKVEKFNTMLIMLGIAVRLIVIDPNAHVKSVASIFFSFPIKSQYMHFLHVCL